MIREFVRGKLDIDEISEVLGDPHYAQNYSFPELTREILGAHTVDHVIVSRYYLVRKPPVVVDFQPSPKDGPFYVEEKRAYCLAHKIVYVPVFLVDRLTKDAFAARLKDATDATRAGAVAAYQAQTLILDADQFMASEETLRWAEEEAIRQIDSEVSATGRKRVGVGRLKAIKTRKAQLLLDLRKEAKTGALADRGIVVKRLNAL